MLTKTEVREVRETEAQETEAPGASELGSGCLSMPLGYLPALTL